MKIIEYFLIYKQKFSLSLSLFGSVFQIRMKLNVIS